MVIKHVIQSKGDFVATIAPDATLVELVDRLGEYRIGAMVVSVDGKHIDGIVSERDIVRAFRTDGGLPEFAGSQPTPLAAVTVSRIMTADVTTCGPETSIDEVMSAMTSGRMRHIPVVQDDILIGLVSIGDIVKARISHLEWERAALVDYVTTGR